MIWECPLYVLNYKFPNCDVSKFHPKRLYSFYLFATSIDPDGMLHFCCISSGSSSFAKVLVYRFQVFKGLQVPLDTRAHNYNASLKLRKTYVKY